MMMADGVSSVIWKIVRFQAQVLGAAILLLVPGFEVAAAATDESGSVISDLPGCVTVGVLYGGSLLGFDREFTLGGSREAIQVGLGVLGADIGLNHHFGPTPRSPYVSVGLWNVGFGSASIGLVSAMYGVRGRRIAVQLGVGVRAYEGLDSTWDLPPVVGLTSLGLCWVRGSP
jgi:hypothetical protein